MVSMFVLTGGLKRQGVELGMVNVWLARDDQVVGKVLQPWQAYTPFTLALRYKLVKSWGLL